MKTIKDTIQFIRIQKPIKKIFLILLTLGGLIVLGWTIINICRYGL